MVYGLSVLFSMTLENSLLVLYEYVKYHSAVCLYNVHVSQVSLICISDIDVHATVVV